MLGFNQVCILKNVFKSCKQIAMDLHNYDNTLMQYAANLARGLKFHISIPHKNS